MSLRLFAILGRDRTDRCWAAGLFLMYRHENSYVKVV